jgi:hypothetical protein
MTDVRLLEIASLPTGDRVLEPPLTFYCAAESNNSD